MKTKNRKRSSIITGALLVLAVAALMLGGIGGARAVLTPSETYTADIATQSTALEIWENGAAANDGLQLTNIPEGIHVGELYKEEVNVKNTGTIEQYVRVSVHQYWTNEEGKRVDLDPALIKIATGADWTVDESASTEERTVLYYTKKLPAGETSTPVIEKVGVDGKLATMVKQEKSETESGTVITTTYTYGNGDLSFNIEISADGIQDHNAKDAAISAWGVDASQFIPGM